MDLVIPEVRKVDDHEWKLHYNRVGNVFFFYARFRLKNID